MSRELFLKTLSTIITNYPYNSVIVFGTKIQNRVSYASFETLSRKLCRYFEQIFENENVYICLNIKTRLCLLPLFIALWRNKLATICVKNEECFKKIKEILNPKFLITDKLQTFNLKDEIFINGCRILIYELHDEPIWMFPVGWDMCYALCTSGSTGLPKLVQVPWDCIYPNVKELAEIWALSETDVIAWNSPFTFDPFFIELMSTLISGACLKLEEDIVPQIGLKSFEWDAEQVTQVDITVLQTTPSIYKSKSWQSNALRILILGGENFPINFQTPHGVRVYNIYGITEISCWSFIKEVVNDTRPSIGQPLNGILYKIENDELWIGSQFRKCLIENEKPQDLSNVVYRRTGDVVENLQELFIIDRTNNIVKIFGNKISFNIYEKIDLQAYDDFSVVFDQENHLIGLFVVDKKLEKNYDKISMVLKNLKPIERPDMIFRIRELPINDHGKTDFQFLRKFMKKKIKDCYNVEEDFKKIWGEILGVEILTEKSFSQCGGDSVSALKLMNRLDLMNISVPASFFTNLGSSSFQECLGMISQSNKVNHEIVCDSLLSVCWNFNMKKCIDATPSFVCLDDVWCVCVGSHSAQISLLECKTGRHLWTVYLGDRIESGIVVSSNHQRLFTGCYDQHIYSLCAKNGEIFWKFKTGGMVKSTPVISFDGFLVFCGSYDKQMYCLDAEDGSLKLSIICNGSILATPVLTENCLIFGTLSGECLAVNSNSLKKVWSHKLKSPIFSSPCLIHEKSRIVFADVEGCVYCFDVITGQKIWDLKCDGNIFSGLKSLILGNTNFVTFGCHDRNIYMLDVTHEPVITFKILLDSPIASSPSIENQYLACVSSAGFLYVIHLLDKKIASRLEMNCQIFSSPKWHESFIFFGTRNDNLICVNFNKN